MDKQNQYTDNKRTEALKKLGLIPESNNGFQIHELLNALPNNISFKKSLHCDETVFIDWGKKTRFFIRISNFLDSWGYNLVSYDNHSANDQSQSGSQFVDLLADCIIYISRMQKIKV